MLRSPLLLAAVLPLLLAMPSAPAADEMPDFEGATLTGDWGGMRSDAWQRGLHAEAGYKADVLQARNGSGRATRNVRHLDLKLRADLERLFGWQDAVAYFNVIDDRGSGANSHAGSLMGISSIEVPVPTTRVPWPFGPGTAWSLVATSTTPRPGMR